MSDFETKEQIYSLLQDDEDNSSDNGFLRFRTTPPKLVRWVVLLSSTFVVSIAIAGTAGFFVGKAVIKDQYKSNIERQSVSIKRMNLTDNMLTQLERSTKPSSITRHSLKALQSGVP